jgi:hypothetical protein
VPDRRISRTPKDNPRRPGLVARDRTGNKQDDADRRSSPPQRGTVRFEGLDQTKMHEMFRNSLPRAALITKTDNVSLSRQLRSGNLG